MAQVRFGPGGFGMPTDKGIEYVSSLGLSAAEIEFTYGVNMSNETAKKIGELAKKHKIFLSIHAPYYINLASEDKQKIGASKTRILQSCERGHYLGAKYVVFHAAFYGKMPKEECYEQVKKEILEMQAHIKQKKWDVELAPETTGKASQFGDLDELLRLAKETHCYLCIDFAHLKARYNGKIDYKEIFDKIKKSGINHIQAHFSGIEFTAKGERRHIVTEESDLKELLQWIKKSGLDTTIINESPDPIKDSLKGLNIYQKLN